MGWPGFSRGPPSPPPVTPPHQPANKELAAPVAQHPLARGETEARRHCSQAPAMQHRQGCGVGGNPRNWGTLVSCSTPSPPAPSHLCSLQPLSPLHASCSRGSRVGAPKQQMWGVSPQHGNTGPRAQRHPQQDGDKRLPTALPCPARCGCSLPGVPAAPSAFCPGWHRRRRG